MKLTSTKSIFLVTALLVLLFVVADILVFAFIRNITIKTSEMASEADLYEKRQDELWGRKDGNDINSLIEKVNSYLVGKEEAVAFIEKIEKEARSSDVALVIRSATTENLGEEEDVVPEERVRLKLETRGSWRNSVRLVSFNEHLPYKIEIMGANLSRLLEGGNSAAEFQGPSAPKKGSKTTSTSAPIWRGEIELTVLKHK